MMDTPYPPCPLRGPSLGVAMSWDRGAPTPVVQNAHQAKQEPDRGPPWGCPCGHFANTASSTHCAKCGSLRPEERLLRMQARASQGLGRGGGYFERTDLAERREAAQELERGVDVFGRRRYDVPVGTAAASVGSIAPGIVTESQVEVGAVARTGSGPRNGLTCAGALPTMAERQKAALERLRNPAKRKASLSPPRTRVYREKSSRSRSREKRAGGFIFSGGVK